MKIKVQNDRSFMAQTEKKKENKISDVHEEQQERERESRQYANVR